MAPAMSKEFLEIQGNYRVSIHSETRTWHDNNIQWRNKRQVVFNPQVSGWAVSMMSAKVV